MNHITLVHLFSSAALFLLIWFVQIVHYPLFRFLDEENFHESMIFHQRSISFIVMPLMLVELVICLYHAYLGQDLSYPILGVVIIIWLTTFFISVPLHNKLLLGKDDAVIDKLINSNWIRTLLWTLKAFLVFTGVIL